jgi:hypothetical protein
VPGHADAVNYLKWRFFCRWDAGRPDVDDILDVIRQEFDTLNRRREGKDTYEIKLFLLDSSGRFDFPGLSYSRRNAIRFICTDSTFGNQLFTGQGVTR